MLQRLLAEDADQLRASPLIARAGVVRNLEEIRPAQSVAQPGKELWFQRTDRKVSTIRGAIDVVARVSAVERLFPTGERRPLSGQQRGGGMHVQEGQCTIGH